MTNHERLLAYAKQRGVDLPECDSASVDWLKHILLQEWDIKVSSKMRKSELIHLVQLNFVMPQLTPAQRKRLKAKNITHPKHKGSRMRRRRQEKRGRRRQRRLAIWNGGRQWVA